MNKNKRWQAGLCKMTDSLLLFFAGLSFLLLGFTMLPAFAAVPQITQIQQTNVPIKLFGTDRTDVDRCAKIWGLSTKDFKHYLWLMKNTPSRNWYKDLDPAEVLALNASNDNEMMRFAKIQARLLHTRVSRELAFNQLYSKAYKLLYPKEKPIGSHDANRLSAAALQSGDRVNLFVGVNTPLGRFACQHLIKIVQATPGTRLDIYFVGHDISRERIERWAVNAHIPRDSAHQQVTLNYGNKRFQSLTKGKQVTLPFVGVVHENYFQPITLSSVL